MFVEMKETNIKSNEEHYRRFRILSSVLLAYETVRYESDWHKAWMTKLSEIVPQILERQFCNLAIGWLGSERSTLSWRHLKRLNYCNQICTYLVNSALQIAVVAMNGSWCTNTTNGNVKITRVFSRPCTTPVEGEYLFPALGFHLKYSGASNVLSCRSDSSLVSLWSRVP
jgi:hypothetical protein